MCQPLHFTCSSTPGIVVHSTPNLCRPAPARVLWSLHLVQYNFSHMSLHIFSIFVEEDKTSHTHPMFSTNFSAALYCLASHYLKPARIGCSPPFRRAPRDRYVRGTWTLQTSFNIVQIYIIYIYMIIPAVVSVCLLFIPASSRPMKRRTSVVCRLPSSFIGRARRAPSVSFLLFFLLTSFVFSSSSPSRH